MKKYLTNAVIKVDTHNFQIQRDRMTVSRHVRRRALVVIFKQACSFSVGKSEALSRMEAVTVVQQYECTCTFYSSGNLLNNGIC